MATTDQKPERKISLFLSIRADSLTTAQAQEIEDKIRDIMDDFEGTDVQVTRGAERPIRTV